MKINYNIFPEIIILTFFISLVFFACDQNKKAITKGEKIKPTKGYVLSREEGEILMDKSKRGNIKIKVSPKTGSQNFAMGTQNLSPNSKVPLHVHGTADEILFVHKGSGTGFLNSVSHQIGPGTTIFIPAGTWHGIESTRDSMEILWFVSPPGLDQFFRDLDSANVSGTKSLTAEEIEEIARKHGDSYSP